MQIVVGENEPAESAIRRFRRAVMQANVIPEVRAPLLSIKPQAHQLGGCSKAPSRLEPHHTTCG